MSPSGTDGRDLSRATVTVTFTCVYCGEPIVIAATSGAVFIESRAAFLRVHGDCLRRSAQQRKSQ